MEVLAEGIFNTETGEGEPTVIEFWKKSALEKALIVLRSNPRNKFARRLAKWAVREEFHQPDFHSLTIVSQQAGLESYHLIFNPFKACDSILEEDVR